MTSFSELAKALNLPSVADTLKELVDKGHVKSHKDAVEVLTLYGIMIKNRDRVASGLRPGMQLSVRREVQGVIALTLADDLLAKMRKTCNDHAAFLSLMRRK